VSWRFVFWKLELVEAANPDWHDLTTEIYE
jgi:hypothetical protein